MLANSQTLSPMHPRCDALCGDWLKLPVMSFWDSFCTLGSWENDFSETAIQTAALQCEPAMPTHRAVTKLMCFHHSPIRTGIMEHILHMFAAGIRKGAAQWQAAHISSALSRGCGRQPPRDGQQFFQPQAPRPACVTSQGAATVRTQRGQQRACTSRSAGAPRVAHQLSD